MRCLRDAFCATYASDIRGISFKLEVGVAWYRGIKPWIARKAFEDHGIFPMDYRFLNKFSKRVCRAPANIGEKLAMSLQMAQENRALCRVADAQRTADETTADKISKTVSCNRRIPSEMLQQISIEMSKTKPANDVLRSVEPPRASARESKSSNACLPRLNPGGSGAVCLTHG